MLRKSFLILLTVALSVAVVITSASSSGVEKASFLTRRGTELLMDGKPYTAVSFNKVDLFWQCIGANTGQEKVKNDGFLQYLAEHSGKDIALQSVRDISNRGFSVARFAATGYYPSQMYDWASPSYWAAMDELVATARQSSVKLIPSIIWNLYLFPDLANETVQDMMTKRDSKSRQYLDMYVSQIVTRYKDDPTILFWEIGNELNLYADLACLRPYGFVDVNSHICGTAPIRVRRDNFTTEQLISFVRHIAQLIHKLDPNHLVCSGYSIPRPAAQHLRLAKGKADWTHDSLEDTRKYIADVHPDPIDIISIHFYPEPDCTVRFGNKDKDSAIVLRTMKKICDEIGKPVVIGEAGGQGLRDEDGKCPAFTQSLAKEVVDSQYPILLYWLDSASIEFCLDKTPTLNKLLLDADKKLAENVKRKG